MSDRPPESAPAYQAAGVDLVAADRFKKRLKDMLSGSDARVLGGVGGFGGCFSLDDVLEDEPVLVASADGVGTKVLVAQRASRHDTVGEDLVNHCVDDLLAQWARPLFFLDYIATPEIEGSDALTIVEGLIRGCSLNGIPLLGGETAEMPDLYAPGTYDLVGFIVGVAPRKRLDRSPDVAVGDVVLGLPSSGLHTNGYTLARKVVFEDAGHALTDVVPWGTQTWADELLAVHHSYLRQVEPLLDDPALHAIAHITGGGFSGNLPRAMPDGMAVEIDRQAWQTPPLFEYLAEAGEIGPEEMHRVFNMGIGFCLVTERADSKRIAEACGRRGCPALPIGTVIEGEGVAWT